MNVFVLCTGRSGSTAFIRACQHITNYTSAHESRSHKTSHDRFQYPKNHIEADNRLSWQLGQLDNIYGKDAFYVHLKRNKKATAQSFTNRFLRPKSMIYAYANGIKKSPPETLSEDERFVICMDYVNTVEYNITHFLKDKPQQISIELERVKDDFVSFWKAIQAKGNIDEALKEFDIKHNKSPDCKIDYKYNFKHFVLKLKMMLD